MAIVPSVGPSAGPPVGLPDADPLQLLDAYLTAHASTTAVPLTLAVRGQELFDRFQEDPPRAPQWGRFLVALGQLIADQQGDVQIASRLFLTCLQQAERHGDHEAAVTAGYNQGVLQERRGNAPLARGAYRAAAQEGFRLACVTANTLRAAQAAVRLWFAEYGTLDEVHRTLLKRSWLGWLWLRLEQPACLDAELRSDLGRTLCAFLLPEDDPLTLAALWRTWPPGMIHHPEGTWSDQDPRCQRELFAAAADAAAAHLADESGDPAAPYRWLWEAAGRA